MIPLATKQAYQFSFWR